MRRLRQIAAACVAASAVLGTLTSVPASAQTPTSPPPAVLATWNSFATAVKVPGTSTLGTVFPSDAGTLIAAGGSLGDVDLLTGSLYGADIRSVSDPGQLAVTDMLAANQLAFNAQQHAELARAEAERRRKADEAKRRMAAIGSVEGIPAVVVDAANKASASASCTTPPEVILGFFKAEAGSYLDRLEPTGLPTQPIRANQPMAGPDTDNGSYDGDASKDWAMGPAQFAPPAWKEFGEDGDGDGVANTQNVYDAAKAMSNMMCWLAARRGVSLTSDNGVFLVAGDYTNGWGADWQSNSRQAGYARKKLEYVNEIRVALTTSTQTVVGPDGCPTSVPSNTMRGKARQMNVYELCRRSVLGAPTPAAAQAIKFTFQNLGVPYSQPRRNSNGYFDCSSYVTRAYASAGLRTYIPGQNAPTTHTLLPHSWGSRPAWSVPVTTGQSQPGDLVFPHSGHVALILVDGLIIHSPRTGDFTHVTNLYSSEDGFPKYRRIDPSKV